MTDSTLDSELFVLINNWGVTPDRRGVEPKDGVAGSAHFNVSAEGLYNQGDCIALFNKGATGTRGWAEFLYMQVGTQNASVVIAAKSFCVQDAADEPFVVTNDPDDCIELPSGRAAVALGAMTDAYFGFFWVGGVCPEEYEADLAGNFATNGEVVAGGICLRNLVADAIGLGTTVETGSGARIQPCGYALAADA